MKMSLKYIQTYLQLEACKVDDCARKYLCSKPERLISYIAIFVLVGGLLEGLCDTGLFF